MRNSEAATTKSGSVPPNREIRDFIHSGFDLLLGSKAILFVCTIAGILLGGFQAWRSPEIWISKMLVASVQDASNEKLKGLSSLLGQNNTLGTDEMDLFATILTSERLGKLILSAKVASPDSVGRIHTVSEFLNIDTANPRKMERWLAGMPDRINISAMDNKASQVVQVTMTSGRPWLARTMLKIAFDSASTEVVRIRGARLRTQLPHLEFASRSAAVELDAIAREVVRFQLQNRSIGTPEYLGKQDSLLRERGVLERKYMAIRQEVEETIINLAKMSPPCMVVDDANLPAAKSGPKRLMILLFGTMFGFASGCAYVLGREVLR